MSLLRIISASAIAVGLIGGVVWIGAFFALSKNDSLATQAVASISLIGLVVLVIGGLVGVIWSGSRRAG